MSQTTYSIRIDSDFKKDFDAICKDFGMSPDTAINEFVKAVVRERRILLRFSSIIKEAKP